MEGLSVNTRMMRTAVLLALCLGAGEAFTLAPRAASRAVHGPLRPVRSANDAMDALDQLLRENEEKLDEIQQMLAGKLNKELEVSELYQNRKLEVIASRWGAEEVERVKAERMALAVGGGRPAVKASPAAVAPRPVYKPMCDRGSEPAALASPAAPSVPAPVSAAPATITEAAKAEMDAASLAVVESLDQLKKHSDLMKSILKEREAAQEKREERDMHVGAKVSPVGVCGGGPL